MTLQGVQEKVHNDEYAYASLILQPTLISLYYTHNMGNNYIITEIFLSFL